MNFKLAVILAVIPISSFAKDNSGRMGTDYSPSDDNRFFGHAKQATAVAKGKDNFVFKFVDETDGRKVVCYFVDKNNNDSMEGKGGISCSLLP